MEISKTAKKGSCVAQLTGDLLIGDVAEAKKQLHECLTAQKKLTLDLEGVGDCDTAGVQLLIAFIKGAKSAGVDLTIGGVSLGIRTAVDRAALDYEAWFCSVEEGVNG